MRPSNLAIALAVTTRVWAYGNSPRVKPSQASHTVAEGVFDQAALELAVARSFGLRHAEVAADLQRLASAQTWDPAPPLRGGPQRCLSSRETIERLATAVPGLLPAEPYQGERTLKRAAMHWRDIFEQDRGRTSRALSNNLEREARLTGRTVWMGGDYIDDGAAAGLSKEEAAERWRDVRGAIVEGSKRYPMDPESARLLREETLYGSRTYYPPHTRDSGPRG